MESIIDELKIKFDSFNEDLATLEFKVNDDLVSTIGEDMNPAHFPERLKTLWDQFEELEIKLKKLLDGKLALGRTLATQIKDFIKLEKYQKITDAKISNAYDEIKSESELLLQMWYESYKQSHPNENLSGILFPPESEPEYTTDITLFDSNQTINEKDNSDIKKEKNESGFKPISEQLFKSIPIRTRRKCTLEEINQLYECLWNLSLKNGRFFAVTKFDLQKRHGIEMNNQKGESKIDALKHLKVIQISNGNLVSLCRSHLPKIPRKKTNNYQIVPSTTVN